MAIYNNEDKIKEMKNVRECVTMIKDLKLKYGNEYVHQNINDLFPFFIQNYPTLYNMIMSTSDLKMLPLMIDSITNICENKEVDKDAIAKNVAETLAEEYIYPKVGRSSKE